MTNELNERFISDVTTCMENILSRLSSNDTRAYFLSEVRETSTDYDTPYMMLFQEIEDNYLWEWSVIDEELPYIVDEVADKFTDLYPFWSDESIEIEMYQGKYDDDTFTENNQEVIAWTDSQMLSELPHYTHHCFLINDEEGYEKFGSSAYVVDTDWLDDFRNDGFIAF